METPAIRLRELLSEEVSLEDLLGPEPNLTRHANFRERPRIVHISWVDAHGAGIAAYRLHRGLVESGANSTMLVLAKHHPQDPTTKVIPVACATRSEPAQYQNGIGMQVIGGNAQRWRALLEEYPNHPMGVPLFSDPISPVRLQYVKEVIEADIVNLHWVAGIVDYATLPGALAEKPTVWTLHDMNPFTGGCHYAGTCTRYLESCGQCPMLGSDRDDDHSRHFHSLKAEAFRNLNINVVTPSVWLGDCAGRSSLLGRFPRRVIPYGLPSTTFRVFGRDAMRTTLGIGPDDRLVLFGATALDDARKGKDYLIEALRRLDPARVKGQIVLAAFGLVTERSLPELPFRVLRLGTIDRETDLSAVYCASDVYVLPTLEDNLPNTVLESLSSGTPVVGFDVGGMPDMIQHQHNGCLAALRDIDALAEGITWVLSQPREALSVRCRAQAIRLYDESVQAAAYMALYENLTQARDQASGLAENAEAAAQAGHLDDARQTVRQALSLYPSLSRLHNDLGAIEWAAGNVDAARASFETALGVNPHDRDALLNLADAVSEDDPAARSFERLGAEYLADYPEDDEIRARQKSVVENRLDRHLSRATVADAGDPDAVVAVSVISVLEPGDEVANATVADLAGQTVASGTEVIVVAAGPVDAQSLCAQRGSLLRLRVCAPREPLRYFDRINLGVRMARGQYCMVVGAGDRLCPAAIELLCCALDRDREAALAHGNVHLSARSLPDEPHAAATEFAGNELVPFARTVDLLVDYYGVGPHPLWRRSIHEQWGYFDGSLEEGADQDLWLRIAGACRMLHVPTFTSTVRTDGRRAERIPVDGRQFRSVKERHAGRPGTRRPTHDPQTEAGPFIDSLSALIRDTDIRGALTLYDQRRREFPPQVQLEQLDSMFAGLRVRERLRTGAHQAATIPENVPDLTIFTTAKSFEGHAETAQRNALCSWARLTPRPDVVLFGDSRGVGDFARELGFRHIPEIGLSDKGTPLVSAMYQQAHEVPNSSLLAYVNADIILTDDFLPAIAMTARRFAEFLMVGRRWDLSVQETLRFDDPGWQKRLLEEILKSGKLEASCAIDYFVFTRGIHATVPPFAIGRAGWDNWFVAKALESRKPVIDATGAVTVVHQVHGYEHVPGGKDEVYSGAEARKNMDLAGKLFEGGVAKYGFTSDATWELNSLGILARPYQERVAQKVRLMPGAVSG